MKHRPYNRLVPATLVSLSLVAASMAGGCSEQPSAQTATAVTTTTDRAASNPYDEPLAGDDLRENETVPPTDGAASPASGADMAPPSFTQGQLEAMVAPVALYPDPLLMEILMAATYPAEVTQAAAWVKENPGLNGKELDDAIADKRWDVSVNSLTHAPKALELLAADPRWMQDLGDAFLAQQDDVLNAVQVMRLKACDLGNLKTTAEQKVTIEPRTTTPEPASSYVVPPPDRVVQIEPVQQDVVYVPTYNPQVIYGYAPPVHYYPTIYAYPAFTSIVSPIISFGVGLAIGGFLWGDLDWHHHHVYARPYYRDRYIGRWYWNGRYGGYNDFYRSGFARDYYWRHDLDHRRGVRYVNRDVDRFYSVRGRDPYRFRDDDYHYDRRKASRGDYDRMPGFRDGRGGRDDARGDFRDGRDGDGRDGRDRDGRDRDGRDRDGRDRDGRTGDGSGESRDWREKAREDARQKMQRDSQTRGDRGPGGPPSKDGDRGGDRGAPGKGPSADRGGPGKDSSVDRGGDRKGAPADRGGKGPSADRGGSKAPSMERGGSKGPPADRGGGKGSSGDRGKVERPSGGSGGGGKVDRPSGQGGGRPPGAGSRGPSMKQGGGGPSSRGGGSSKGGSVQRGGGSSKGGSVQRGGGSSKGSSVQRGGGSSKGSSVQRGGGGGRSSGGGGSMRQGGGDRGGSSQRGGGSQGGRSGGSSKGGGGSSKGGGGERGKGGGRN